MNTVKIYTNDLEMERAKQNAARQAEDRLPVLKNRIARAQAGKLATIALVAKENGDRTIEKLAREKLGLEKGQKLADVVEIVESRRPQRNKQYLQLTGQTVEPQPQEA